MKMKFDGFIFRKDRSIFLSKEPHTDLGYGLIIYTNEIDLYWVSLKYPGWDLVDSVAGNVEFSTTEGFRLDTTIPLYLRRGIYHGKVADLYTVQGHSMPPKFIHVEGDTFLEGAYYDPINHFIFVEDDEAKEIRIYRCTPPARIEGKFFIKRNNKYFYTSKLPVVVPELLNPAEFVAAYSKKTHILIPDEPTPLT